MTHACSVDATVTTARRHRHRSTRQVPFVPAALLELEPAPPALLPGPAAGAAVRGNGRAGGCDRCAFEQDRLRHCRRRRRR